MIAVGTTTTRTLEAVAREHDGRLVAGGGTTDLFIYPGFEFRVIRGLLTNFHLPQSSLLMLVCAFAGRERVLAAYREAISRGLSFLQLRRRDVDFLTSWDGLRARRLWTAGSAHLIILSSW